MNRQDAEKIILDGDAAAMKMMFDSVGLAENGETHYSKDGWECAADVLGFASAASYSNPLPEDLFEAIIDRTAVTVNTFLFADSVVVAAGIGTDNFSLIPEDIQTALREGHYTDKVGKAIEGLDNNAFAALLSFILKGKINALSAKFNLPIIRRMHAAEERVIPENLMLAYMATSVRKPESSRPFAAVIDVSGGWPDGMPVILEMLSGGFRPFRPF